MRTPGTSKDKAGGNTETPAKAKRYCFTLNNFTENDITDIQKKI